MFLFFQKLLQISVNYPQDGTQGSALKDKKQTQLKTIIGT
jgi:hypothetical protein